MTIKRPRNVQEMWNLPPEATSLDSECIFMQDGEPEAGEFVPDMEDQNGRVSPVMHVLLPDGRTVTFRSRAILLPECSEAEAQHKVYALFLDGKFRPFVNPADGSGVVVEVPPVRVAVKDDPERLFTWSELKGYTGLSMATLKRHVAEKLISKTFDATGRPRIKKADVDAYLHG